MKEQTLAFNHHFHLIQNICEMSKSLKLGLFSRVEKKEEKSDKQKTSERNLWKTKRKY